MWQSEERRELIRAVNEQGEAVTAAAARYDVSVSTAYRWMREVSAPSSRPTFVELVRERAVASTLLVRVGVAVIEVRAGFDAQLLREVAAALREDA